MAIPLVVAGGEPPVPFADIAGDRRFEEEAVPIDQVGDRLLPGAEDIPDLGLVLGDDPTRGIPPRLAMNDPAVLVARRNTPGPGPRTRRDALLRTFDPGHGPRSGRASGPSGAGDRSRRSPHGSGAGRITDIFYAGTGVQVRRTGAGLGMPGSRDVRQTRNAGSRPTTSKTDAT